MASKKTATNRKAVPYTQIQKLWNAGKSYIEIAKAIKRYKKDAETEDVATKSTRAVISNMLRGVATAWKDKSGKVCKLQPRDGMRNIGVGKKAHRSPKKATKKVAAKKTTAHKPDGKSAAAGER